MNDFEFPVLTPELLTRYDVPGPRYTSYPTADRFVEDFSANDYVAALSERRAQRAMQPLSLYVHVPFCESLCYYCACNKIITKHHERALEYLRYLQREIDLHVAQLGRGQTLSQLHFGGGTPTFLSDPELTMLMEMIGSAFGLTADGEYSIEVDPRTADATRLRHLRELGFNRLSFGVQDFDPEVQKAVHRVQPAEQVFALVEAARALGFESVNVDLIYGLPRQSAESFARTLEQVNRLRPDRIALYAYAHLPERFKPQRRIDAYTLPTGAEKIRMLAQSLQALRGAGYDYIGMDHFALPDDALAVARREGKLHRNFQGYSTHADCDLIGLGVSAIGRVGGTYSQNAKTLDAYYAALDRGELPVARGLHLDRDDEVRRALIMEIMCRGEVRFDAFGRDWGIDFGDYFAPELEALRAKEAEGMLDRDADGFRLTPQGWYFVRGVAMVFDRHLQGDRSSARFSRII